MEILGFDAGTGGAWGTHGPDGYWYPAIGGQSLPPGIVSASGAITSASNLPTGDARCMALPVPPGGALTTNWLTQDGYSEVEIVASGAIDYIVSWRLIAMAAGRPGNLSILSPGGATLAGPIATPDLFLGVWARCRITGSCRLYVSGNFARHQGWIIKANAPAARPGRLLCFEAGHSGRLR